MSNFEKPPFDLPMSLSGEVPEYGDVPSYGGNSFVYTDTDTSIQPDDTPAFKNFPFALSPYPDGAIGIAFGSLIAQMNVLIFDGEDGSFIEQTGIEDPQVVIPAQFVVDEGEVADEGYPNGTRFRRAILPWRGEVYLYWETDEDGNVLECDLRPVGEIDSVPLPIPEPAEGAEKEERGKFSVKIGTVPEPNDDEVLQLEQDVSSDVYWISTLASEESSSSSSSSSGSDDGGLPPSDSDGSDDGDSGSDKSTAIVPMDWHTKGYGALFTMESNEVLFEFVLRDLEILGRETVHRIDDRFLKVCDPDTLVVAGAPCGDKSGSVGAVVEGGNLILSSSVVPFLRPNKVTLKLTGVRKGFSHMDMPERSRAQFVANEKFINSAYPRE